MFVVVVVVYSYVIEEENYKSRKKRLCVLRLLTTLRWSPLMSYTNEIIKKNFKISERLLLLSFFFATNWLKIIKEAEIFLIESNKLKRSNHEHGNGRNNSLYEKIIKTHVLLWY